ncbi:hypothetical protein PCANC_11348 [Puccinia coronata f. sp. avenae]|uniref:Uncharacterized protein n=1 Tax=Puccinia coronata f. sp. avenae TaxID=200324 RepID=A0A2N5VT25_9BASI|nr:hypothetical protein PCANC_11348 [Puccinia coronata f. sp. avenae]
MPSGHLVRLTKLKLKRHFWLSNGTLSERPMERTNQSSGKDPSLLQRQVLRLSTQTYYISSERSSSSLSLESSTSFSLASPGGTLVIPKCNRNRFKFGSLVEMIS